MPRFEHALVVGKFAPLHRGHELLLARASEMSDRLTIVVWSNPDFVDMSNEVRVEWVRELLPTATVLIGTDGPENAAPDAMHRDYVKELLARHDLRPDVVVTSESYGPGLAEHLGIAHESVDPARELVPVSGTAIRCDVHEHREHLDPRVYSHFVERVVLMGAESTGKTTLAERLATEFSTTWVPEVGRLAYEERGGALDLDDYVEIAERHLDAEDVAILNAHRHLFVDTNAVTTMFFSHYYNRDSRPRLRALAAECSTRYAHVIVCDDDIPFEQDGWRDSEDWRTRMQGLVLLDLTLRGTSYSVVTGSLDQRVAQVRSVLDGGDVVAGRERASDGPRPSRFRDRGAG